MACNPPLQLWLLHGVQLPQRPKVVDGEEPALLGAELADGVQIAVVVTKVEVGAVLRPLVAKPEAGVAPRALVGDRAGAGAVLLVLLVVG